MGQHVLPGNPPVPLILRRSRSARRISLRVSSLDGRVTLTMPAHLSERAAMDFAREKEDWLRGHLQGQPHAVLPEIGAAVPVEGVALTIVPGLGRRVRLGDGRIEVPGPEERYGPRLQAYLRELARDRLAAACDLYAGRLGRSYVKLTLRDTRSRWGSCTHDGGLMFSWRLIMAPPEILSYVAAHEVAHLAEMNHSRAFWATVEKIHGPCAEPRRWLRENGAGLHRHQFTS